MNERWWKGLNTGKAKVVALIRPDDGRTRYSLWLFSIVLLLCYGASVHFRAQQYDHWLATPGKHFVGNETLIGSFDGYHWLRLAREYSEGIYPQHQLQSYPDNSHSLLEKGSIDSGEIPGAAKTSAEAVSIFDLPLLSALISAISPLYDYNVSRAGMALVPWLASLFILPIGIYGYRMGFPAVGLMGGLAAALSSEYLIRTSTGRVDTDILNLFFPILASLFLLLIGRSKDRVKILIYSAAVGVTLFLFTWWYEKTGFILIYLVMLVVTLLVARAKLGLILMSLLIYTIIVNPSNLLDGVGDVVDHIQKYQIAGVDNTNEMVQAPDTNRIINTIVEAKALPISKTATTLLSHPLFFWIGLAGVVPLFAIYWRQMLPLLPLLALGLLSFVGSRRYIMYLAPFVGMGFGLWAHLLLRNFYPAQQPNVSSSTVSVVTGSNKSTNNPSVYEGGSSARSTSWQRDGALYATLLLLTSLIIARPVLSYIPSSAIPINYFHLLDSIGERLPKNSAIYTWWDLGYPIGYFSGLTTFHDGESQFSPKTTLIARSLLTRSQQELWDTIRFISTGRSSSADDLLKSLPEIVAAGVDHSSYPEEPIYILLTTDMLGKVGAINQIALLGLVPGEVAQWGYTRSGCQSAIDGVLSCGSIKVEPQQGLINGKAEIKQVDQEHMGTLLSRKEFPQGSTYLHLAMSNLDKIDSIWLADESLYDSNLHQMLLLGNHDSELFEEVLNARPYARMFRVKFPNTTRDNAD